MKTKINFYFLFLITTAIVYATIGFVRWEFDWVKHLANLSSLDRLWCFIAIVAKIIIDYGLWSYIKTKSRDIDEHDTYLYDNDNKDIPRKN
jgi:hypothetical protein